jgi:murein L,D-transpeptidase YafK
MMFGGFVQAALTALSLLFVPTPAPKVTEVRVDKSDHVLELWADKALVKRYKVALGVGGAGPKQFEGDMKTPVGTYSISGLQMGPFHRFLNVSYPNADDRARFAALTKKGLVPKGKGVGHSIGVHGVGDKKLSGVHKAVDWTHGCIALDDAEIEELVRLVPVGTKLVITD